MEVQERACEAERNLLPSDESKTLSTPRKQEKARKLESLRSLKSLAGIALSPVLSNSTVLLLLLTVLALLNEAGVYGLGLLPGFFYKALLDRSRESFLRVLILGCVLVAGVALFNSSLSFLTKFVALMWRTRLVVHLHWQYFHPDVLWKLSLNEANGNSKGIDNPDQRITRDVELLTESSSSVLVSLIVVPVTIVAYTIATLVRIGWLAPMCIFFFFFIGSTVSRLVLRFLVPRVMQQEKVEGNFRFSHASLRSGAESVCFLETNDEVRDFEALLLSRAIRNKRTVLVWEFVLAVVNNLSGYFGSLLNYIFLGIEVFYFHFWSKDVSDAELAMRISQNSFFTLMLISSCGNAVKLLGSVGDLLAYARRVSALERGMRLSVTSTLGNEIVLQPRDADSLCSVEDVSFSGVSDGPSLVRGLSFLLRAQNGDRNGILVRGPNGTGKTTLLRVLAGFTPFSGAVSLAADRMFVPQKVFVPIYGTTLRSFMCHRGSFGTVQQVQSVLDSLDLEYSSVEEDFSVPLDWSKFTRGHLQLLYCARVLLHSPSLVFLDEATNGIPSGLQSRFFRLLRERNVVPITVSHDAALRSFHHSELLIEKTGWTMQVIP